MKGGTDYFSWAMFKSIVPPILSLSFGVIAGFTRTTRAELTEVLTSEFMPPCATPFATALWSLSPEFSVSLSVSWAAPS